MHDAMSVESSECSGDATSDTQKCRRLPTASDRVGE